MTSPEAELVHAVGEAPRAVVETANNPERVDHVWIRMDVAGQGTIEIAVNTCSLLNRDSGFDSRVRVGRIESEWEALPRSVLEEHGDFDYADVERGRNVFYEHFDRTDLETFLIDYSHSSLRLEAWGAPYLRRGKLGIHQIHSRRASCAVSTDVIGRDGALRFHFPQSRSVMLLLKFCGQP